MVNINAALPTAIATPFHPPTESLRHDNLIKPIIPKTEMVAAYTKFREDEQTSPFSSQTRGLIQNENEQSNNSSAEQEQSNAQQRRLNFFAKRSELESQNESKPLEAVKDYKLVLSVIQEKYHRAVRPIPEPTINYSI